MYRKIIRSMNSISFLSRFIARKQAEKQVEFPAIKTLSTLLSNHSSQTPTNQ
jgi:hypothetical protein